MALTYHRARWPKVTLTHTPHPHTHTCTLIYPTVPSSTRANTVLANAITKKVNEQDTKTFPECYVGRNGK